MSKDEFFMKGKAPVTAEESKAKLLFEGPYNHEEIALMSPIQFSNYLKLYSKKYLERELREAKVECEALLREIQGAYIKGANEEELRCISNVSKAYRLLRYYSEDYSSSTSFPIDKPKNGIFYRYGTLDQVMEDTLKVYIPTLEALDSLNKKISEKYIGHTKDLCLGSFGLVALELKKDFPISTGYLGTTGI